MNSAAIFDAEALEKFVRDIAREARRPPTFVTQRTVEPEIGLPPREYLRLARAGAFPCTKEKRLVLARYVDVVEVFERRLRSPRAGAAANDTGDESSLLARIGARRVSR